MNVAVRVEHGTRRGMPVWIEVNGERIGAYQGESIATALLCAQIRILHISHTGVERSVFCNMGLCQQCQVFVCSPNHPEITRQHYRWFRACVTPVVNGMVIDTTARIGIDDSPVSQ